MQLKLDECIVFVVAVSEVISSCFECAIYPFSMELFVEYAIKLLL